MSRQSARFIQIKQDLPKSNYRNCGIVWPLTSARQMALVLRLGGPILMLTARDRLEKRQAPGTRGGLPLFAQVSVPTNPAHKVVVRIVDLALYRPLHMLGQAQEAVDIGLCSGRFQLLYLGLLGAH